MNRYIFPIYNTATELLPRFADLGGYLVLIEQTGLFPEPGVTETLNTRYPVHRVLLDYDANIPLEATVSAVTLETYVSGLYLIEDGIVRYRFIGPGLWEAWGVTDLIKRGAATFLAGGEPTVSPITASPGASVDRMDSEGSALILRIRADAADALENDVNVQEIETEDGGSRIELVSEHPGSQFRFLLESLVSTLKLYGVRGVALVQDEAADLDKLTATFPAWTFIKVGTPEAKLRWLEVRTVVIDTQGEVIAPFLVTVRQLRIVDGRLEAA